nr:1-aminocyclopropane-1-carboxylate oxidase homolog 3-like [Malus domestica]
MPGLDHELEEEMKKFDETKAGVKGLVDSGVTKLPRMFKHPPEDLPSPNHNNGISNRQVPVIDLEDVEDSEMRSKIINDLRKAAEEWGFFQIVNHSVPLGVMDDVLKGIRRFHEQPQEAKEVWYSRDFTKKVNFVSNAEFKVSLPACWRDTLSCKVLEDEHNFEAIPEICRAEIKEYMNTLFK